jgi:SAM-dependent methyltransferase
MSAPEDVPDRVRFAVDLLDLKPAERVIEVGCGPGVAAAEVCRRLTSGTVVAVDRSGTAIARTAQRNSAAITAGKLATRCVDLTALDLPEDSADAAFAIDVNLFWTRDPAPELAVLQQVLRPDGRLVIAYGASGPQDPARVTAAVQEGLRAAGFRAVESQGGPLGFAVLGRT